MTQMNVPLYPLYAKMKEYASTLLVLTSEFLMKKQTNRCILLGTTIQHVTVNSTDVSVRWGSLANTVKTRTTLAYLHHA